MRRLLFAVADIETHMSYPHLGLTDWPFRIVPEPEYCDFLADRSNLRKEVHDLLVSLENRPTSDIQLVWSWYGAGKTHTLFYLANQCASSHLGLLPIYVELPRESRSFVDLYRATVSQLPIAKLIDSYLEHSTRPVAKPGFARALDTDLNSALTQAVLGERRMQVLLNQWLLGNSLPTSAHHELGVGGRIATTEKCAVILADIISVLAPRSASLDSLDVRRVIWVIDEVQRVDDLAPSIQRSVLSGLVGVFNKCATGLTIILSYTGAPREESLPEWIPPDLADRIGLERPLLLPPLRSDEAMLFVRDLLERFRLPECRQLGEYYPFERDAIEELIRVIERRGELKPRIIMEALDASLRVLEPLIRAGQIKVVGTADLRESLGRLSLDWGSEQVAHKTRKK